MLRAIMRINTFSALMKKYLNPPKYIVSRKTLRLAKYKLFLDVAVEKYTKSGSLAKTLLQVKEVARKVKSYRSTCD